MITLNLVDYWWTIQGEGRWSGNRAFFVRFPFCNLECSWCDTEFNVYKKSEESEFLESARSEKARFAVLTGGEPMMNKQLPRVVELLRKEGFKIAAESNGTFPPPVPLDWLTISPKRFTKDKKMDPYWVHPDAFDRCQEFKYVVDSEFDFKILERHRGAGLARLSLSPEFNDFRSNVAKIIEYIKENPEWAISLQTHKWLGVQ